MGNKAVFLAEGHGIVDDHILTTKDQESLRKLAEVTDHGAKKAPLVELLFQPNFRQQIAGVLYENAVEVKPARAKRFTIPYLTHHNGIGGNAVNTGIGYRRAMEAIRDNQSDENLPAIHTQVTSSKVIAALQNGFGRNNVLFDSDESEGDVRTGVHVDEHYLSQTPEVPFRPYDLPRTQNHFFLSSMHPDTNVMQRLIERTEQAPDTKITVGTTKEMDPRFLEKVDLHALNAMEAISLVGTPPLEIYGENMGRYLAKKLTERGPRNALVTNRGLPAVHYNREKDTYTMVTPPSSREIRSLVLSITGKDLPEDEVSKVGCGDTMLGIIMGLQDMQIPGVSLEEIMQFAVTIARLHAFSPNPNIAQMDTKFLREIASKVAPRLVA